MIGADVVLAFAAFVAAEVAYRRYCSRRRRRLEVPRWPVPITAPPSHVTRRPRGAA